MLAAFFRNSANHADTTFASRLEMKAKRAYEYGVATYAVSGPDSACTASAAADNCIGDCGGKGRPARGVR